MNWSGPAWLKRPDRRHPIQGMPLFHYRPEEPPCRICGEGFDLIQASGEDALSECPTCGQKVSRALPSSVSSPRLTRPPSVSEARSAGFKVYRKTSDGSLERQ